MGMNEDCGCLMCIRARGDVLYGLPRELTEMILCPSCGNKRCPHATNHKYLCTNSNDMNQEGSVYQMPIISNSGGQ